MPLTGLTLRVFHRRDPRRPTAGVGQCLCFRQISLTPPKSFRPLLNFLESFLQLRSGLPLFGHIHDGADDLGDFTRVIPDRMSDRMEVLYGAVRENDSKINLRI